MTLAPYHLRYAPSGSLHFECTEKSLLPGALCRIYKDFSNDWRASWFRLAADKPTVADEPTELINTKIAIDTATAPSQLDNEDLGSIFGIDLDMSTEKPIFSPEKQPTPQKTTTQKMLSSKPQPSPLQVENLTGKKLRKLREKNKLSVIELAESLQVTPASIYRWEQNTEPLKLNTRSKNALELYLKGKC